MKERIAKWLRTPAVSNRGVMVLLACSCLWLALPSRAQILINEVMADNQSVLLDDGYTPDWVELWNTNQFVPIPIGSWRLLDITRSSTNVFIFPAGISIPPNSPLIVYFDSVTNIPGYHTKFGLNKNGGYLELRTSGGVVKDRIMFGLQIADFSIGRYPNGTPASTWQLTQPTPGTVNRVQALGPIWGLKINEWSATNYSTKVGVPGRDWLEVYNPATNPVSLGQLVFTSDYPVNTALLFNKPVTNLSFIAASDFIKFDCMGNDANENDELDFKLSHNSGETITLLSTNKSTVVTRISFPGNTTIPGYWLPAISYGWLPDGNTNNLMRFATNRTTPGKSNFQPMTNLVVNEILSHTDVPLEDAVEFYNPTDTPVDMSYWWLSNTKDNRQKFRIPANSVVPAYGYKVFYEMIGSTNGFNTNGTDVAPCFTFNSAHGDSVVLTATTNVPNGGMTGFELVESFGPANNGVSFGRYVTSDGKKDFMPMPLISMGTNVTAQDPPSRIWAFRSGLGATNPYPIVGPLVISEIHYHPPDIQQLICTSAPCFTNWIDDSTNEFVEIFNMTSTNVPLFDTQQWYRYDGTNYASGWTNTWHVRGSIDFDFPATNVYLAPSNYLLVVNFSPSPTNAAMLAAFRQKFSVPASVPIFGPYSGKLGNGSGSVQLRRPDWPQGPPAHADETGFVPYITIEDVNYHDTSPWPTNADGRGFSLQRVSVTGYGNDPTNWVDAMPSPGNDVIAADPYELAGVGLAPGGAFQFSWLAQAGVTYTIQSATALSSPSAWSKVQDYDALPTNGWRYFTNAAPTNKRFYRVVAPMQR